VRMVVLVEEVALADDVALAVVLGWVSCSTRNTRRCPP
jgi:hypothetical protein